MVSWTAQLPTNQRQTKGLLLRPHRQRKNHEREAELLNAIQALQGQVEVLKQDLSKAKRIPKKAALAPVESSSSNEGSTVAMDEVDSDPGAFDNNVNPDDGKSSTVTSRPQRRATPSTPNTSVMGITNVWPEQTRVVRLCQVHS
jgi:hypothetical protein